MRRDLTWMDSASCAQVDPDLWHKDGPGGGYTDARKICRTCPVRTQCAAFAEGFEGTVAHSHRFGLWADKPPRERAEAAAQTMEDAA